MGSYLENLSIDTIIVGIGILLIFSWIVFMVRMNKLNKKQKSTKQENLKLMERIQEIEPMYANTVVDLEELKAKYEELKSHQEKLRKLAYMDPLTELPNRTAFVEMLDNVMMTLRNEEVIAVMDIDLDNFKNINDTIGHSYGDELLIDVTYRLKQAIGEDDYLARIGGDEFVVLTQNIDDAATYEEKIEKIRNVFSYPFILSTKEYFVTVSIGVAFAPKDGKTAQIILKNVDSAMFVAKANGKNTYSYFDYSYNQKITEKIEIQSELRKALEKKEFVLHYQTLMDLKSNQIVGVEALIRWQHPTKGLVYPNDFIQLAEETGIIVDIGEWVIETACLQLAQWQEEGYRDIHMAVNLSARQFKDVDMLNVICDVIQRTGIDPSALDLEITESIALDDIDYTISMIQELGKIGVNFSLDDFGTGYSSMNYLKRLPVHNLKIDKSFLDTALEDASDQKIIQTIISLAQTLKLSVIAEGVEKVEQESILIESKCDMAQGYLYSKPVPSEEVVKLLKSIKK